MHWLWFIDNYICKLSCPIPYRKRTFSFYCRRLKLTSLNTATKQSVHNFVSLFFPLIVIAVAVRYSIWFWTFITIWIILYNFLLEVLLLNYSLYFFFCSVSKQVEGLHNVQMLVFLVLPSCIVIVTWLLLYFVWRLMKLIRIKVWSILLEC